MKRITSAALEAKGPGRHHAGFPGLYMVVKVGKRGKTRRSWVYRHMNDGRSTDRGLGSLAHVTLEEARTMAARYRLAVRLPGSGETMPEARSTVPTFQRAMNKTFEAKRGGWKNEKTGRAWLSTLSVTPAA